MGAQPHQRDDQPCLICRPVPSLWSRAQAPCADVALTVAMCLCVAGKGKGKGGKGKREYSDDKGKGKGKKGKREYKGSKGKGKDGEYKGNKGKGKGNKGKGERNNQPQGGRGPARSGGGGGGFDTKDETAFPSLGCGRISSKAA